MYITQRPLTYSSFLNSNKTMNIELKILVLSSQHEDMLFKIRFDLYNQYHQKLVSLYSESLRIISKADHKRKAKPVKIHTPYQNKQKQNDSELNINEKEFQSKQPKKPHAFISEQQSPSKRKKKEIKEEKENKEINQMKYPQTEEGLLQLMNHQQSMLQDIIGMSSNPLSLPMKSSIQFYSSISQQQRIMQLMRFLSELSQDEFDCFNEMFDCFRKYQTYSMK